MAVSRDAPVYKLIHVMLSHRPFVGNARCEFDGRQPETRKAVKIHAQCGLLRVFAVLQRMKDLGIYDNSLIVLMADHGAWIPVENFESTHDMKALTVAMATPMLAIKPPAAMHGFRVSSAPSAMTDIAATIADIAGIDSDFPGNSVFELSDSAVRERFHLTYGYGYNPDAKGYLFPMQEWLVRGDPYVAESWQHGTRYYAAGANKQ
jgi:arylsulfatase A-like enzyme